LLLHAPVWIFLESLIFVLRNPTGAMMINSPRLALALAPQRALSQ